MENRFRHVWLFLKNIYLNAEKAVIGKVLLRTDNTYEQARIRLIFDFAFCYIILLTSFLFINMLSQNRVNILLIPVIICLLAVSLLMLGRGVRASRVGLFTSGTTIILPMLSSFLNHQDLGPKYILIWVMSVLLSYITVNVFTTLAWSLLICGYLTLIAWIRLNHIDLFVTSGASSAFQYLANPLIVGMYLLFLIRSLGQYYRNIISMEQRRTEERQKQHLSLINQHLTRQFLMVKGFSRSGKTAFLNGELELLENCFTEIEKQCGTAIDYLNDSQTK